MKVHNDLKELLEDFVINYYEKGDPFKSTLDNVINDFVSSNSLALGKPEPLAKNKQKKEDFKNLYPKYKCFKCKDWFHLPYKKCSC